MFNRSIHAGHRDSETLATSIKMGIGGLNLDLFSEIQEGRILVDKFRGKELLKRAIVMEAMSSILSEDTSSIFR